MNEWSQDPMAPRAPPMGQAYVPPETQESRIPNSAYGQYEPDPLPPPNELLPQTMSFMDRFHESAANALRLEHPVAAALDYLKDRPDFEDVDGYNAINSMSTDEITQFQRGEISWLSEARSPEELEWRKQRITQERDMRATTTWWGELAVAFSNPINLAGGAGLARAGVTSIPKLIAGEVAIEGASERALHELQGTRRYQDSLISMAVVGALTGTLAGVAAKLDANTRRQFKEGLEQDMRAAAGLEAKAHEDPLSGARMTFDEDEVARMPVRQAPGGEEIVEEAQAAVQGKTKEYLANRAADETTPDATVARQALEDVDAPKRAEFQRIYDSKKVIVKTTRKRLDGLEDSLRILESRLAQQRAAGTQAAEKLARRTEKDIAKLRGHIIEMQQKYDTDLDNFEGARAALPRPDLTARESDAFERNLAYARASAAKEWFDNHQGYLDAWRERDPELVAELEKHPQKEKLVLAGAGSMSYGQPVYDAWRGADQAELRTRFQRFAQDNDDLPGLGSVKLEFEVPVKGRMRKVVCR